ATPAVARVWMAEVPILAWLTSRNMMAKPSMRFSNSGSSASGVTSRPVKPVPPVVMMTSIAGSPIQALTCARIFSTSSVTIARCATVWPAFSMRSASVAPDLSSASARVSETVSTAIFSGMNWRASSRPGIEVSCRPAGMTVLWLARRERVARPDGALLQAGLEPALALLRRTVREAVGHDVAPRLLLQTVIADRRGGLQRGLDVTCLDQILPVLPGVIGPYAGETVGLELDLHLEPVCVGLAHAALLRLHLRQDAELVLHMMADLVRDHVGLRELAGRAIAAAEAAFELAEERRVEIDFLV